MGHQCSFEVRKKRSNAAYSYLLNPRCVPTCYLLEKVLALSPLMCQLFNQQEYETHRSGYSVITFYTNRVMKYHIKDGS